MSTIPLIYQCPKCGEEKPFTNEFFHRARSNPFGLCTICKECARAKSRRWHTEHREYAVERSRRYADAHRQEIRDRKNEWYAEHAEYARKAELTRYFRDKATGKKRKFKLDPAKTKARQRRYVASNPDRRKASSLRYAKSVKGRVASRKRRAMEYSAEGSHSDTDILALHAEQDGRCAYCGITLHDNYHVDHVHPLVRGGSNWPDNLALSCAECNLSKGNKTVAEWQAVRGW